jgi:hypothetical protein
MRTPKPTLIRSYTHGWQQFTKWFLHLFLVGLIYAVASSPGLLGLWDNTFNVESVFLSAFVAAYGLLVAPIVSYGSDFTILRFVRDEQADIRGVFDGFRTNYLNIVLANLLVFAIVGIGIVLFLLPGVIFACRLSFVPYLVMDRGLDPVAAIEKSWFMTRGHGFRIFAMYLVAIVLVCLGLGVIGVGAFFALIWVWCAFASLYHAIDLEERAALNGNGEALATA